jgi:hypothetical protein
MAAQTVWQGTADCPHPCCGLSGLSHGPSIKANRTSRTDPRKTDRPLRPGRPSARATDRPLLKLGPSTNRLQQKPKAKLDQTKQSKNTKNTATNWDGADCLPGPCGSSERCRQSRKRTTPKVNSPNPSPDLPNGRSC